MFVFVLRVYSLPVIHSYPKRADEVLIPWELRRNDGKNMPVVLLHDSEHEQSLLLQGCTKLEESGLLILQRHTVADSKPRQN